MPKTKLQEVVFTILMVFVMVYAMICYNISLNMGGMSNIVFLNAFHELVIMGPIAFILDFFLVSKLAFGCAMRMVDFKSCDTGCGQADHADSCYFINHSLPDVSDNEPCSNTFI